MNTEKLIALIDKALEEADTYIVRYYHGDEKPMTGTKKALCLLKSEVINQPNNINERVLRGMADIGGMSVKAYENTPLEEAIGAVTEMLYYGIPHYKHLEPLRMDFGKGDPI